MGRVRDGPPQAAATLTELRFPSPGLRGEAPLPWVRIKKDSNSVGVAISRRRYRSREISGPMANATTPNIIQGDTKTQKAVATAGGFAWVALVSPPVGKRVFLLAAATITCHAHRPITMSIAADVDAVDGRCASRKGISTPPGHPRRLVTFDTRARDIRHVST